MRRWAILFGLFLATTVHGEYLGSWNIDDYLTVSVTTHQASTGAAYAATGNVNLRIYEDDTDVQIVADTAMTAFDSITGLYVKKVQLTAASGFEAGKHYTCLVQATVDGVSGICTKNFQILASTNIVTVLDTAPATAVDVRTELDANSTQLAVITSIYNIVVGFFGMP